ncbi:hypothetical protein MBLNU459_g3666t1 [Dothideomycetes sp. NU459]
MADELSAAQCILLAVHLASEANINALHTFTPSRPDVLKPELVLRILLAYLPESVDPSLYTSFVREVSSRLYLEQREALEVDTSAVRDISDEQAQKRVSKLNLLELSPPTFPPHAPKDPLVRFLCHRAYRIDIQTGLLTLVPALVTPFLEHSDYLRTWFIAMVLPLLRLGYEYYPSRESQFTMADFEEIDGERGIELLLSSATSVKHQVTSPTDSEGTIGRDLRGLVGPWMYGNTERKRRRLNRTKEEEHADLSGPSSRSAFIELEGVSEEDKTGHDWEYAFAWMVRKATDNFPLITNAIEDWDGPGDVDLGGYGDGKPYLDKDTQSKLERQYAQAAFASCYAVTEDTSDAIDGAHGILCRLAQILNFEPPPELATSVQELPAIDNHAELLHKASSTMFLEPHMLLTPNHPLTTPKLETYMLLQMLVYSAYQLSGLGHKISIVNVAKLRFFSDEAEQLVLLQKILHGLAARGKRDDQKWLFNYNTIVWLWDWNIETDGPTKRGAGILGNIKKSTLEKEMLKVLVSSGSTFLVDQLYFSGLRGRREMTKDEMQDAILGQAMQWYDSASNGNRTRGSMKKASDLINNSQHHFSNSHAFSRASALIAATHSLSFYSLILQHGVPFQPVNIRASADPLSLLPKVLEQNANSYTKLDDLVSIGRNLVSAGLPLHTADGEPIIEQDESKDEMAEKLLLAERKVIAMCIEAALAEDDFETAYSYIVNRLAPPDPGAAAVPVDAAKGPSQDDTSWRAAFLAGRYRPRTNAAPTLRRLEQRTELLSLALLLAPSSHLSEILGVWRRCEEETLSLHAAETAAEQRFDDSADRRRELPGGFADQTTDGMIFGQQRREVGRMTGGSTEDEVPMGLFDVARGAAKAFSRNAFPLRGTAQASGTASPSSAVVTEPGEGAGLGHQRTFSSGSNEASRVRKRDMLSSAVSGGLASGIGWVLGASPVDHRAAGERH